MHQRNSSQRGATGVGLLLALSTGFSLIGGFSDISGLSFTEVTGLDFSVGYSTGGGVALDSSGDIVLHQPDQTCDSRGCTTTWSSLPVELQGLGAGQSLGEDLGDDSLVLYQDGGDLILRVVDASAGGAAAPDTYIECFDADTGSHQSLDGLDPDDGVSLRVAVSKAARNGASALLPYDYRERITATGRPVRGPAAGEAVCVAVQDGAVVSAIGLGFFDEADALFGKRTSFNGAGWIYSPTAGDRRRAARVG